MKFGDYYTTYQQVRHASPNDHALATPETFMELVHDAALGRPDSELTEWELRTRHVMCRLALIENLWAKARRPFYNLWPSILAAMLRLDLNAVMCQQLVMPHLQLVLRLPAGQQALRYHDRSIAAVIFGGIEHTANLPERLIQRMVDDGITGVDGQSRLLVVGVGTAESLAETASSPGVSQCIVLPNGATVESVLQFEEKKPTADDPYLPQQVELMRQLLRLYATLCLLADDPEVIDRVVLSKDTDKYDKHRDPHLVEKAEKRGIRGWDVGRHIEVMPHYRRPHLALRWTGEGKRIPKVVPIKGSIVHREVVTKVPTGFAGAREA